MARGFLLAVGDDVGLEQFSPYAAGGGAGGIPLPTIPNINALATSGWRASAGCYAQQLCSPTRSTIQSGVYPFRHGVGDLVRDDFDNAGSQEAFPEWIQTLGETMLAGGFRTACFGKWHMSNQANGGYFGPQRMGYETYIGNLHNLATINPSNPAADLLGFTDGQDYYDYMLTRNGDTTRGRQFYITYLANVAIDWIRQRKARDEDWFLYLPWFAAHTPYSVPPSTHFNTAVWGAAPYGAAGVPTTDIGKFKALIEALDFEMGRVLQELDYADDTVFWCTDNGTGRSTLNDTAGLEERHPTNSPATYLNYYTRGDGKREYRGKDSPFQTGILVPLYARGAGVTVAGNTASAGLFSVADLYPTIVELAGLDYPDQPCDGISFVPLLQGTSYTGRTYAYTEWFSPTGPNTGETYGNRAITDGTYKLIRGINEGTTTPTLQYPDVQTATGFARLYKLTTDWREETNLATQGTNAGLAGADLTAFNALDAAMAALLASDGL